MLNILADVGEERIERPYEKPDRERDRERERDRDRDRDRERDDGRERDRRKQRRDDMVAYGKNKRGNVQSVSLPTFSNWWFFFTLMNVIFCFQGEKMRRWTQWIQVLILMPQGTVPMIKLQQFVVTFSLKMADLGTRLKHPKQ